MSRALLFAGTGIAFFVFWWVTGPGYAATTSMTEWPNVLWFSATLMVLAVALVAFGRLVGGRSVVRLATIAGAGTGLSSVANVLEDGFRIDAAFFGFVLGLAVMEVALIALVFVLVRAARGKDRLLALVPAGTTAGILMFVIAGGPIILMTWLAAAGAAIALERRSIAARPPVPAS